MVSLFCRHNRFTADCPICSRGTVLDSEATGPGRARGRSGAGAEARPGDARRPGARAGSRPARRATAGGAVSYRGPSASIGPYERDGEVYEVRLERVPGGLRLAEWSGGRLRASAPVLAGRDLGGLIREAAESRALEPSEHEELSAALVPSDAGAGRADEGGSVAGASNDSSGATLVPSELSGAAAAAASPGHGASPGRSGELRDELRVERLGEGRLRFARWVFRPGTGWDRLDAPTMLPVRRYVEALADAARRGVLAG